MITRIVKMQFEPQHCADFEEVFRSTKPLIEDFPGALGVKLMKDAANENTYFTISHWNSLDDLEHYRQSYLFQNTWKKVKTWFSFRAEAWSLTEQQ